MENFQIGIYVALCSWEWGFILLNKLWCGFEDIETAEKILKTDNQAEIKKLGRQVKNYNEEIWSSIRFDVMRNILYYKFSQNPILRDKLISTGDADIYEASPYDKIWGIGSTDVNDIKGKNLLGKALMEIRATLKWEARSWKSF